MLRVTVIPPVSWCDTIRNFTQGVLLLLVCVFFFFGGGFATRGVYEAFIRALQQE
jgi:hypothetical protein